MVNSLKDTPKQIHLKRNKKRNSKMISKRRKRVGNRAKETKINKTIVMMITLSLKRKMIMMKMKMFSSMSGKDLKVASICSSKEIQWVMKSTTNILALANLHYMSHFYQDSMPLFTSISWMKIPLRIHLVRDQQLDSIFCIQFTLCCLPSS